MHPLIQKTTDFLRTLKNALVQFLDMIKERMKRPQSATRTGEAGHHGVMCRSGNTKKKYIITGAIALVVLLTGIGIGGYHTYRIIFRSNLRLSESTMALYIPTDCNAHRLVIILSPYLKDRKAFEDALCIYLKAKKRKLRAGKYTIGNYWNNARLLVRIYEEPEEEVRLSFNYCDDIHDVARKVAPTIEADSASLVAALRDSVFLQANGLDTNTLRAAIIPNTYQFYWDTSAEAFRNRMIAEGRDFWDSIRRAKAEALGMTPLEVSTLASIVQKETTKNDESRTVAGLYINRLNKGWKLQSDPTVIYAVREEKGKDFEIKRVLNADLKTESPYNTYLNKGLPSAPICIPDVQFIDAVLNAEKHEYMYMCASVDKFGYHEFAKTGAEHSHNRKKYTDWLNKQNIKR